MSRCTAIDASTPLAPLLAGVLADYRARMAPGADPYVRSCPCCPRRYRRSEWLQLPLVGDPQDWPDGRHEYRDCICGTTLLVVTPHWAAVEREAVMRGGIYEHLRDSRPLESH